MDLIRYLLFENPLTLLVALGMAALTAGIAWVRGGSRRARTAAIACLAAGAGLTILAWAVETDRERLTRTLRTMAMAADTGNADAFIERVSADYRNGPPDKAVLAAVVRLGLQQLRATADTPIIDLRQGEATVVQVYQFRPAPGSRMILSTGYDRVTWEGVFAPDSDGQWRLRCAVATQPRRITPEEAGRYLQRLPAPERP
jgi:hypothetical protein